MRVNSDEPTDVIGHNTGDILRSITQLEASASLNLPILRGRQSISRIGAPPRCSSRSLMIEDPSANKATMAVIALGTATTGRNGELTTTRRLDN